MSIIPLPSPPTESLHKFKALTGILLLIASVFYCYSKMDETYRYVMDLEGEVAVSKIKQEYLSDIVAQSARGITRDSIAVSKIAAEVRTIKKNQLERKISKAEAEAVLAVYTKQLNNIEEDLKQNDIEGKNHRESARDIDIILAGIHHKVAVARYNLYIIFLYAVLLVIGVLVGTKLAFDGFRNWAKIQMALDSAIISSPSTNSGDSGHNAEIDTTA